MRQGVAARELHMDLGKYSVAKGLHFLTPQQYGRVSLDFETFRGAKLISSEIRESLWWLGIIHTVSSANEPSTQGFMMTTA